MRTIKVLCMNYTGAHFRGFNDPADSQTCLLTLTGNDQNIIKYILENLSYGGGEQYTFDDFINVLGRDAEIALFDGCGGVFEITEEDKVLVDLKEVFGYGADGTEDIIHELSVNVDTVEYFYDHLNDLLRDKLKVE